MRVMQMTANRRMPLNILATHDRLLCALVIGLFGGWRMAMGSVV